MSRLPDLLIGLTTFVLVRLIPQSESDNYWANLGWAIVAGAIFWFGLEWYAVRRARRILGATR